MVFIMLCAFIAFMFMLYSTKPKKPTFKPRETNQVPRLNRKGVPAIKESNETVEKNTFQGDEVVKNMIIEAMNDIAAAKSTAIPTDPHHETRRSCNFKAAVGELHRANNKQNDVNKPIS